MLKQRSHMLMQQQQAGQGPAKRARIDRGAGPAGPLPTTVRGTVGQKRPAARVRRCWSVSPRTRCGRTSRLCDCRTRIPRRRGNRCLRVVETPSRRRPSWASRNRRAARAGGAADVRTAAAVLLQLRGSDQARAGVLSHPSHVTGGEVRKDAWCNACYNAINGSIEVEGTKYANRSSPRRKTTTIWRSPGCSAITATGGTIRFACFSTGDETRGRRRSRASSCILSQLDKKERTPTTTRPSSQLPASVLPQTRLSYFLEERLRKVMGHERNERARQLGKPVDEVPAAEG